MIRETELISLKDGKTKSLTEFVQDLAPTPEPMELTPLTPVDTGGADPVALSSYIDGIADTSASDAITAGLASGGSIKAAIDASGTPKFELLKTVTISRNQNTITTAYVGVNSYNGAVEANRVYFKAFDEVKIILDCKIVFPGSNGANTIYFDFDWIVGTEYNNRYLKFYKKVNFVYNELYEYEAYISFSAALSSDSYYIEGCSVGLRCVNIGHEDSHTVNGIYHAYIYGKKYN